MCQSLVDDYKLHLKIRSGYISTSLFLHVTLNLSGWLAPKHEFLTSFDTDAAGINMHNVNL